VLKHGINKEVLMRKSKLNAALMATLVAATLAGCQPAADFAEVLSSTPVTVSEPAFGEVVSTQPITDVVIGPRQVCSDVAVSQRLPERDGNVGGTVAGAVIGGLLGNQVGSGDGRKAATVAGAIAGGFAGREADRRHVGGRIVTRTEQQCQTINEAKEQVVSYRVSYRDPDGGMGEIETRTNPGKRVALGERERVIGYDVTYRYNDQERRVRMAQDPGTRLPVIDGAVVLQFDRPMPEAQEATPRG